MMCFPGMIAKAAQDAGMKVPQDPDGEFSGEDFPHFAVFCNVQLGRSIQWGNHWENAKVIAAIPEDKIKTITVSEIEDLGFVP